MIGFKGSLNLIGQLHLIGRLKILPGHEIIGCLGGHEGRGGFGSQGTPGAINGTTWEGDEIWLRRTFELGDINKIDKDNLRLRIHHDDACVVYINGVKAAELNGWTSSYTNAAISDAAKKALRSGANTMAIYCQQDQGGQYIDAGLSIATGNKALSAKTLDSVVKE